MTELSNKALSDIDKYNKLRDEELIAQNKKIHFDSDVQNPLKEAVDIIMNLDISKMHQPKNGNNNDYFRNQYLVVLSERLIKGMTRGYCAKLLKLKSDTRIMQIEEKLKRILSTKMRGYQIWKKEISLREN